MKKIILLLGILLLIAGCTETAVTDDGVPYVGGNNGVSMEFITGSPPDEIFDGGEYPFSVSIKLENSGEFDVKDGFLRIRGINPDEFGSTQSDLRMDMPEILGTKKNADQSVIKGMSEVVTFPELNYQKDEPGNFAIESFRVSACYDYETKASSKVCVKENNVDGLKDNEVCLVNQDKSTVNSGSPIHVTNMKETSKGSSGIQLSFDVAHVGGVDNKWFPTGDNECSDLITNTNMYSVEVEVDPIIDGKYPAKCSGFSNGDSGVIRLFNGEPRKVICSFDIGDQENDFETRVNVKLKYRYLQYVEKRVLIKDLGISE